MDSQDKHISPDEFDDLVAQALGDIPVEFRERLENIEVFVEEEPSPRLLQRMGLRGGSLLGLYEGVPKPQRSVFHMMTLPDRITIFRQPILRVSHNRDEVVRQVRQTVVHEIAHHFGISDRRLRQLGY